MLEQLLEKQLIQLSKCKRPEQARKVDDSNYCKYHQVISHQVQKYFVLKELILRLAREKNIELDLEEVAQTNHAAVTIISEAPSSRLIFEQRENLVQFKTFEPIIGQFYRKVTLEDSQGKERSVEEDDEGWIVDENSEVIACHAINATEEESIPPRSPEEEGVSKDLLRFNVDDLLSLPQETKTILINALLNSGASSSSAPTTTYKNTPYCMSIDFSDEDLLLGSKLHNRPLQLSILMDELSNSKLVIQGFNQGSQRVIGMIRLELIIGDLKASALFHVIDSRTTYKLLLSRPWIHGNGVVTSTLHQCFKFYQDGVKKIEADSNPFSKAESHFVDVKFYLKNDNSQEVVPVEIPRVNREDNLQLKSLAKEVDSMEEKEGDSQRTLAFDRISPHVARAPVFERLSMTETERKDHQSTSSLDRRSTFQRLTTTFKKEKGICQASRTTRPSAFERLSVTKKKNVQTPRAPIFNCLGDGGPYVQTGFSIDTKKKESISRASVCRRIKYTDVESCHGKEFPCEVKRLDVILTNPEKEDSEQGEGEILCHRITILEELEIETPEEDAEDVPQNLDDGGQSTIDELKEVNLGTIEESCLTFISASLSSEEKGKYMSLLTRYKDIFTWLYKEMPGLDPKVAVHHFTIKLGYQSIKQAQRRFRPDLIPQIEAEVNKLIEAGFIPDVKYLTWIANIVSIRKKIGQLRVCVNFRDLNNACPKDDFPLPITEIMVDVTIGHEALSLMDGSSGCNQIRLTLLDEEMTAFKTSNGIYCYKVMPFGLKNAGATYQRPMQKVFGDMLHKYIECYVDYLMVKSKKRQDHLKDLKVMFDRFRKYQLRMNPFKCAFDVTSGKFLGFIVRHRGIEIDQSKIDAIQKMPRPHSLHDLRSLQGRLIYIRSIKKYLLNPPVLGAPISDKSLILYIAAQEMSLGAFLAQEEEKGKERALYYLSRTLVRAEVNYSPIEKMCLALFFVIDKLRALYAGLHGSSSSKGGPYKTLTIGLQMALEIGVSLIEIYDDSKFIINKLSLQYDVKHEDLKPYFTYARQLMERFDSVMLEHVPRIENKRVDALANLATALMMLDNVALNIPLCQRWIMPPILPKCQEANVTTSYLIDEEDWRQPIIENLEHGKLPKDFRHKTKEESIRALKEAHADSMDYANKCEACQYHGNFIHQPLEPLHPTVASWSFEAWGLDLVGLITPKSSVGHSYILAATDYFSKWAEAIPLREFKQYKSSMYNAAVNDLAEAFDKTLCNLLKKIISKSKRDWQERIGEALWAYRTTHQTPTRVTPYSLVYSVEVVLPFKREIPSLRMAVQEAQQALECYQARMSKAFDKHVKPRSFQVVDLVLALCLCFFQKTSMVQFFLHSKRRRRPIAPTRTVDLTTKARSSPSRSWIADGEVTSPNDEGVQSLLPGRWI
ncbi:uncharacterized protein E5676_scaffold142G002450 [Cucumis melo var. makuwa]|uniref:Uncharacterized protein n=1 Tax=Cucumis melo var. makuwa TaxID=1194695 RepID=A0A5D3DI05_CUCMM|nr:uncharacterized protein E5676_scaffold142G002450 [Cucumis melo var. makuwa]